MSGTDDTPLLDFGATREAGASPILICAGQAVSTAVTDGVRTVEIGAALELGRGHPPGDAAAVPRFETTDPHMSRAHALLRRTDGGTVVLRDLGSRNGTAVDGVPLVGERPLTDGNVLFIGAHVFVYRLVTAADLDAMALELARPFCPVPTISPALARLCERLRRLARSDVDLLLGGEAGVGKEVIASAVHRESGRTGPFVSVNCAALPDTLLESELFGHARGGHATDAPHRAGLIEQAEGGTLFLDELGDMSGTVQSKVLRFLEDRLLLPLGSTRPRRIDVRVVAATRRSVHDGGDTDDASGIWFQLAARLGPEPLVVPPLRARSEDIGILARHFLRDHPWTFDIRSYRALFLHRWLGNVRELEKALRMAAVLSAGRSQIAPEYLALGPAALQSGVAWGGSSELSGPIGGEPQLASRPTPDTLALLLERHKGNVADVARALHRQRTLVWRWVRKAGLDPARYRAKDNGADGSL